MMTTRRRRFWKLVVWTLALGSAIVVGGVIAAYHYVTEGDTLVELIRREAPRYLPRCRVDLAQARIRPFAGSVILSTISVGDGGPGGPASIAQLPYLQINYDPWAMLHGRFEPKEVVIPKPTIRLRRRADGTWNCQGLLAEPWPGPKKGASPPIRVREGTVELMGDKEGTVLKVLTKVSLDIPAVAEGAPTPFALTAEGDLFERVELEGVVDCGSGRVAFTKGKLDRLTLSDALRGRLPAEVTSVMNQVGFSSGEVDAKWSSLVIDPTGREPLRCVGSVQLRRGIWNCPKLPFPISEVAVDVEVQDGVVFVTSAKGSNGPTSLSIRGRFALNDPLRGPFEVEAEAIGLQLDGRLRGKTPEKFLELWDLYFPEVARSETASAGRINLSLRAGRPSKGAEVGLEVDIDLVDVAMKYKHFPYQVEHVQGRMHLSPKRLTLDNVHTTVGNRPLRVDGIVDDPGPDATARLHFAVDALPVDSPAFLQALPPDVRKVVLEFAPTGTVQGVADLVREPPVNPKDDPMGRVRFDAVIDLNPGCSATWAGLRYPVRNLKGRLEIHPDLWIFEGMHGKNGQADIRVDGRVDQIRRDQFKVDLKLKATNLPFNEELRDALPKPWRLTWDTLNPTGASDIDATVKVEPGRPDRHRIEIRPRPKTGVTLRFDPVATPGVAAPAPLELPMDDVGGQFVYDTTTAPPMTMTGVAFTFHRAPVTFARGQVYVKDTGEFGLGVTRLEVADLLLDDGLRRMMPPVMSAFARRLDERKLPKIRADLGLGWSGKPGESAWCKWNNGLVILVDNKLEIGGRDIALDSIQGQLEKVRGSFNGRKLELDGDIGLDSVSVLGQQLTDLRARMYVHQDGVAGIDLNKGTILGGMMTGRVAASLDATPRYEVELAVDDADIQEYANNMPGHQTFKGRVSGRAKLSGQGYDLHSLTGGGHAKVIDGDLGTLPFVLRFLNKLKLAENAKTAFDSAEMTAQINNGETTLKPVQLIGNTFSLKGDGKLDVRGNLDLKLELVPGRDTHHIPLLSDVTRELGGLFGAVRVEGPIASPTARLEALPPVGAAGRYRTRLRGAKDAATDPPVQNAQGRKAAAGVR